MRPRITTLLCTVLALAAVGCGSDGAVVDTGTGEDADTSSTATTQTTATTTSVVNSLPGAPIVEASAFTVDHGCGHGFAKGAKDQTIGFVMFFDGEWTAVGPSLVEPIDLATNDEWTATIIVGKDLFANWCDDAIEEDEPVPIIDAEYSVVQGVLAGSVDGQTATATLSNLVAEPVGGNGDVIEIFELELTNDAWGFFAG